MTEYQTHCLQTVQTVWAVRFHHCPLLSRRSNRFYIFLKCYSSLWIILDMKWGQLLIMVTYVLWCSFMVLESKYEDPCLQNYSHILRGNISFLLICPNSTPHRHTHPFPSKEIFFFHSSIVRVKIISHTQKHGCCRMNHLFPQRTAWPLATPLNCISSETAETFRK